MKKACTGSARSPAWTLRELASRAGLPPRTVRYYIARGLLPGPAKAGRGACYGDEHRARLAEIAARQRAGASLAEIAAGLAAAGAPALPPARRCLVVDLADGVRVTVDEGAPPWRMRLILRALAEARRTLGSAENGQAKEEER